MVLQYLKIKADIENVENVRPEESKRRCATLSDHTSSETKARVFICPDEEHKTSSGRGVANFVMKWKDSNRQCNVSIVDAGAVGQFTNNDNDFVALVAMECRNCEIIAWHPTEDDCFVVVSEGGEEFDDVALDDDWCDVDEAGEPVQIIDIETTIGVAEKSKKKGGGKRKKKNRR